MSAQPEHLTLERLLRCACAALKGGLCTLVSMSLLSGFSTLAWAQAAQVGAAESAPKGQSLQADATSVDVDPPPPERALKHYERGRAHYLNGRYRDALLELEIAINLDPKSPELAFNVARVYELLGEVDHAIAFYRRYLDMLPRQEQHERQRTLTTLQRLEGARHVIDHAPKPAETSRRRGVADTRFWTFAGLSIASFAAAGTSGALALSTERSANDFVLGQDGTAQRREELAVRADRLALASDILLGAGVGLGVTAVLLFVLRERTVVVKQHANHAFGLGLSAQQRGAFLSWRRPL